MESIYIRGTSENFKNSQRCSKIESNELNFHLAGVFNSCKQSEFNLKVVRDFFLLAHKWENHFPNDEEISLISSDE